MEIWSTQQIKMEFLPFSVNTIVWMHNIDANEIHGEKSRWELHKNATDWFQRILKDSSGKTAAVWPLISHHINHSRKTNKTCGALLEN